MGTQSTAAEGAEGGSQGEASFSSDICSFKWLFPQHSLKVLLLPWCKAF